jgi:hypothetical protein
MSNVEYPDLENDNVRIHLVISILDEFPSVRRDVIAWIQDKHKDEI